MVGMIYKCGGSCEELTVTSAYLPYDSNEPPPTNELRGVIDYWQQQEKQLIIGCDANVHHIIWGNTCTNPRKKTLWNTS
jgi:hypothetical protein